MIIQDYNMPAKLTFRKETTNEGKVFYSVSIEAADKDGTRYMLNVTECKDAKRLLPVFEEAGVLKHDRQTGGSQRLAKQEPIQA